MAFLIKYWADRAGDRVRRGICFFKGILFPSGAEKSALPYLFRYYAESI
jgi:hypothetical protein